MRILHVLDHSLPIQSGYALRTAAILREQKNLGWQTLQVTGPKQDPDRADSDPIGGLHYHRTERRRTLLGQLPVGDQIESVRQLRANLRQILSKEHPDIIHAHSPCLNGLAAFGLGLPVVYELRSSWEDAAVSTGTTTEGSLRYRASRWLETFVLRRAAAVTTICEGLRQEAIRRGVSSDRLLVVPNAVDADALRPRQSLSTAMRTKFGLQNKFVLGFVGSFFAWEGLDLLIQALQDVIARRPDVRLLLVGGGIHEAALRETCKRLEVEAQVTFAGQVPHTAILDAYDAIDLLVYPRRSMRLTEMVTPLKPLEAMALGKAVLASDVGGHRELVSEDKTGVLFQAGSASALATAILRVMEDHGLQERLRENGPAYVRQHRAWPEAVRRYGPLYADVLRRESR
jgi:PEP-CTERM/exosortase A-associated glycosyltransferase